MTRSVPRELDHPCNCFGTHGQFETDQNFHEMEKTPGCNRTVAEYGMYKQIPKHIRFLPMASRHNVREFETGATRDKTQGKPDFEGYLSPLVLHAYGLHMLKHQEAPDGSFRESDNWQKGIPQDAYMKSGLRHCLDWHSNHRGMKWIRKEKIVTSVCALIFNAMGYLHEYLQEHPEVIEMMEKEVGYER